MSTSDGGKRYDSNCNECTLPDTMNNYWLDTSSCAFGTNPIDHGLQCADDSSDGNTRYCQVRSTTGNATTAGHAGQCAARGLPANKRWANGSLYCGYTN
jgi:hypothetical protein